MMTSNGTHRVTHGFDGGSTGKPPLALVCTHGSHRWSQVAIFDIRVTAAVPLWCTCVTRSANWDPPCDPWV